MIESFKLPTITPETLTGSIVSFNDEYGNLPLKSCTSLISGYQEGSGIPSPQNVRPLHAFSSATLNKTGKNLVNININTSQYSDTYNFGKVLYGTFTLSAKKNDVVLSETVWIVRIDYVDGTYDYCGDEGYSNPFPCVINATSKGIKSITYRSYGITSGSYDLMFELGDIASPYEPFGNSYTFTFGQDIYQGSIDWKRGVVVGTMAIATFDGSSDEDWNLSGSSSNNQYYITIPNIKPTPSGYSKIGLISSYLPEITPTEGYNYNNINGISGWESGQLRPSFDVTVCPKSLTDFKNYLSTNPLTVAYPLATPIEIPLGGINLLTQEGVNNIFCDTGDTSVTHLKVT